MNPPAHTEFDCPFGERIRHLEERNTKLTTIIEERLPESFKEDWGRVKDTVLAGNGIHERVSRIEGKMPYIIVVIGLAAFVLGSTVTPWIGTLVKAVQP